MYLTTKNTIKCRLVAVCRKKDVKKSFFAINIFVLYLLSHPHSCMDEVNNLPEGRFCN